LALTLEPTPDILRSIANVKPHNCKVVGFALEVGDGAVERAREKLRAKALDLIVMNRADEAGAGFESETNRVTLITEKSEQHIESLPKSAVAEKIFDSVEALL
jgi:phosphopantothenoylcysteine decarboxylase/phosphopantothenate--cysteine ligase